MLIFCILGFKINFFKKAMDLELKERFQNYQNDLSLYKFFKCRTSWLCKNFYNQKFGAIICESMKTSKY